jgi:phosphohistidine phosphatase
MDCFQPAGTMTMLLFFLRHGDASSDSRYDDHERPLTDLGIRQATQVGTYLHRMNPDIQAIFSSPLKRAVDTAAYVSSEIKKEEVVRTDFLLNGSDPQQLFKHLNRLRMASALLVGHEPSLSEIISLLVCGNRTAEIEMRKCSLALVEVPVPILKGAGLLKFLIPVALGT